MASERRAGLGTNQEAVRRHNLGTALRFVHGAGQISRAELTTLMGLNRSTIAALVGELQSLGVVEQALPVSTRSGAGRPSAQVRLADDGPYVVAVDLGVDRAVVARVALGGTVVERATVAIPTGGEAWQVGSSVASLIRRVVEGASSGAPLLGVGISIPGMVRRGDGLVRLAPNLGWQDVSFGAIVLAALGVEIPVQLGNDADLGALAEHRRGVGMGIDDLVYISGNVGVGAGVIAGGRRLDGAGGYSGEVGHLPLGLEGRTCHCGNRSCWETEIGAHAIAEAIDCPVDKVAQLDEVLDGYGEPPPQLRDTGIALGHGLASIVNVFNPRLVVLGGYFRSLYSLVPQEVNAGLAERALPAPLESVVLSLPGLGSDSTLLGAAEIAFEPLFVDPVAALGTALLDVHARLAG